MKRTGELDKKVQKHDNIINSNKISFPILKRSNYFYGKLMSPADFQEEQNYFLNKQRLINRMLFGIGVVSGLEVIADKSASVIRLSEGFALDGYGREIVLPAQMVFNINQKYTAKEVGTTRDLFIWIKYNETLTDQIPAVGEAGTNYNMIVESSKIEVDWVPPEAASIDKIVLAKVTVESDGKKIYVKKIDNSATVNSLPLRKKVTTNQRLCELQKTE